MKRKTFILFIIFTFVLSNIGMPLSFHYCKTMDSLTLWDAIPLSGSCEMHSPKPVYKCCGESNEYTDTVKPYNNCCLDYSVDYSVKEIFAVSKTEVNLSYELSTLVPVKYLLYNESIPKLLSSGDRSPPVTADNKKYLSISVLII